MVPRFLSPKETVREGWKCGKEPEVRVGGGRRDLRKETAYLVSRLKRTLQRCSTVARTVHRPLPCPRGFSLYYSKERVSVALYSPFLVPPTSILFLLRSPSFPSLHRPSSKLGQTWLHENLHTHSISYTRRETLIHVYTVRVDNLISIDRPLRPFRIPFYRDGLLVSDNP